MANVLSCGQQMERLPHQYYFSWIVCFQKWRQMCDISSGDKNNPVANYSLIRISRVGVFIKQTPCSRSYMSLQKRKGRKTEVMRRQGRRCQKLLDNLREKSGYCKLKAAALHHAECRRLQTRCKIDNRMTEMLRNLATFLSINPICIMSPYCG